VQNPVDMIASASAEDYLRTIEVVADAGVDAVVVIFIPPLVTRPEEVAAAVRSAADTLDGRVPVLSVFMSSSGVPDELRGGARRVPTYAFPEEAARALAHAVRHGEWRSSPEGSTPEFDDVRDHDASAVIAGALAGGPRWLEPGEVSEVLSAWGIPQAEFRRAATPDEAATTAGELGGAVALKAVAPGLVHKTEAGAVRIGLSGADEVRSAAEEMAGRLRDAGTPATGFVIQRMVPPGVELLVGVVHDPVFGPVLACGAGGTAVELLHDVAVRITPITDLEAADMLRSLATFPLLEGYRGSVPADVPAVEAILLRVSALVEVHPEIAEMDLNPVMAGPDGAVVVDARIRVESPAPPVPLSARRR
jgi:acyl-CoA synthetase (NDP forming)